MSASFPDTAGNGTPRIEVRGVKKCLGGKPVLCGLNLKVAAGESLVIIGGSGAGKSVLLKHMIGLMHPDEGQILIDGIEMKAGRKDGWNQARQRFGMSFQEGALFDSMNVFENIAFPLRRHQRVPESEIRTRVAECLALVNLPGVERKMPNELSGGMRRRVGFARAIANRPEILLFDEPNTGLDPITSAVIDGVLTNLRDQMSVTMVTITHDTRSAFRIADRIAMLREGRIAAVAPPELFRQLPDPYLQKFLAGEPLDEENP